MGNNKAAMAALVALQRQMALRGQLFGFIFVLLAFGSFWLALWLDREWAAPTMGHVLSGAFGYAFGRRSRAKKP